MSKYLGGCQSNFAFVTRDIQTEQTEVEMNQEEDEEWEQGNPFPFDGLRTINSVVDLMEPIYSNSLLLTAPFTIFPLHLNASTSHGIRDGEPFGGYPGF